MHRRKVPKTRLQKKFEKLERLKRYTKNWDQIRRGVYKRDGYRCRCCGKSHCKLNCHHIVLLRVSKSNDLRNLITLCDECHGEIEQRGLTILKSGGHKVDVVRMTARYLIEKKLLIKNRRLQDKSDTQRDYEEKI
jgi:hypothetical protein